MTDSANERNQLKKFEDLGLAESLLRAVSAEGYTNPTPIQAKAIPVLLAGQDVLGIAQTGTGKTASFVLPLLNRIARNRDNALPKGCRALILTPTRELAAQIADNIRSCSKFMKVSVAVIVGGVKPGPQIRALSSGVDIVVATPGRLIDHMKTGAIRLDRTASVVIDEADQMLDLGFVPAIRTIMGKVPKVRQTVLMSATMPPQIRALAQNFLTHPTEISVAPAARPVERIAQSVRHVARVNKQQALTDILSDENVARAIVFTRTKRGADRVNRHLQKSGLSAAAIHGNKSQGQRERTLSGFRSGKTTILVATDIAARGIDIDDVSHVVNFELPNVPEAYVHRIGRTARAGRTGVAISLCDPSERGLLRDIERLIGNRLECEAAKTGEAKLGKPARNDASPASGSQERIKPNKPAKSRKKKARPAWGAGKRKRPPSRKQARPDGAMSGLVRMLDNIGSTAAESAA